MGMVKTVWPALLLFLLCVILGVVTMAALVRQILEHVK